jgi:hypothetical protein
MQKIDLSKLVLKGEVKKNYSINANADLIYEYLSDIRILLKHVPNVTKVQLRPNSGRARLYFNFNILAVSIDAVVDIDPVFNPETRNIQFTNPETPFAPIPSGFVTGTFVADMSVTAKDEGNSRITSQLTLGFDSKQVDMISMFSKNFIQSQGPGLLKDYMERLSLEYINRLADHFSVWQRERKKAV